MKRKKNNLHLTITDRREIENLLNEGKTITEISNIIFKDRSNISREIQKHFYIYFPSSFNNKWYCLNASSCNRRYFGCEKECSSFVPDICNELEKSPHVCNGCDKFKKCKKLKYLYKADIAHQQYLCDLKKSRSHTHYNEIELSILNNDFTNLVLQNCSIYHSLMVINQRGFNFKKSSIYRQIKEGRLQLKLSNLPRYTSSNVSKEKDKSYKRNIEGHTYEDYIEYVKNNQQAIISQMDTVEGIKDLNAPVLLTFEIVQCKFLFAFIIEQQKIENVILKLKELEENIGNELWNKISEIILTDNGKEFYNYEKFQNAFNTSNIYYCHPYSSFEKGSIENSHELIRRVIPKGVSLKPYTQHDINILINNINSLYRESLDGKCPFDLIKDFIPLDILKKMGYHSIEAEKVNLTPNLLGKKNIENITKYLDKIAIKKAHINL